MKTKGTGLAVLLSLSCMALCRAETDRQLHTPPDIWEFCQPWTLRKLAGAAQTSYGSYTHVNTGDGGLAVNAKIRGLVSGVAAAPDGSVYFVSSYDHAVRKIAPNGVISRVAGQYGLQADYLNNPAGAGDGGLAINAKLSYPFKVRVDAQGNLYIVDLGRIRKVAADGKISTVAGTTPMTMLDPLDAFLAAFRYRGPATSAKLPIRGILAPPLDLRFGPDGSMYILFELGISKITPDGNIAPVVEGGFFTGSGGIAVGTYRFAGIAFDAQGRLHASANPSSGNASVMRWIVRIAEDGRVTKLYGNDTTDAARAMTNTVGPMTPDKPLHIYKIGFDAQNRLWWTGGTDTTHFAHFDGDNVIRWSGMLQTHTPSETNAYNGPAPLRFRSGPPDDFDFLPNGRCIFSQVDSLAAYTTICALDPGAPARTPNLSVAPAAANASVPWGSAAFDVQLSIKNSGNHYGVYQTRWDTSLGWIDASRITSTGFSNMAVVSSALPDTAILPSETDTRALRLNPAGLAPGTYTTKIVLHTVGVTRAPIDVPVTLTITNQTPVANAGRDQAAEPKDTIQLDGTASSDPDHGPQPLTYAWKQIAGPAVALDQANASQPTFSPASVGDYTFRLTVSDGSASSSDDVVVHVIDSTPPTVDVTSIVLKGTVDGTGSAPTVKVNGQAATVTGNQWSKEVSIDPGMNAFNVVVTDESGNTSSVDLEVQR